jgi:hypothetical protein
LDHILPSNYLKISQQNEGVSTEEKPGENRGKRGIIPIL